MLYQSIQLKNRLLDEQLQNNISRDDLNLFLDILNKSLSFIVNTKNYQKCLSLHRKWETLYYHYFNEFYDKKVTPFFERENYSNIEEFALDQLELFFDIDSSVKIVQQNKPILDEFNRKVDPKSGYIPTIFSGNNKNKIKYESYARDIDLAESEYRNCRFDKSINKLFEIVSYIKNKSISEDMAGIDVYFLSWAYHDIGNVCYTIQNYKDSYLYYQEALRIKNNLVDSNCDVICFKLSLFSTKLKLHVSSFGACMMSGNEFFDQLLLLKTDFQNHRAEFMSFNSKWTLAIEEFIDYAIGKAFLYLNNPKEADNGLENSYRKAIERDSHLSAIRAVFFGYGYGLDSFNNGLEIIDKLFQDYGQNKLNIVNVRRLISGSIPYEICIHSVKRYEKLYSLFNEYDISPIDNHHFQSTSNSHLAISLH